MSNSINKKGKKCGVDSIGNELYFENTTCPINDIIINKEKELKNKRYIYSTIPLENGKYLHYTNENTNGTIYVQMIIRGEKKLAQIMYLKILMIFVFIWIIVMLIIVYIISQIVIN